MSTTPLVVTVEISGGSVRTRETLNPADTSASITLSAGNLHWSCLAKTETTRGTLPILKPFAIYAEHACTAESAQGIGFATIDALLNDGYEQTGVYALATDGSVYINNVLSATAASYGAGDTVGFALINGLVWISVNGEWFGGLTPGDAGSSATAVFSIDDADFEIGMRFCACSGGSALPNSGTWNFGASAFAYPPPAGCVGLFAFVAADTIYLSTQGYTSTSTDTPASTSFLPRLKDSLEYTRSVSCQIWGRTESSGALGFIDVINTDGELDEWFSQVWRDRTVIVRRGSVTDDYADFALIATAVVDRLVTPDFYTNRITIRDKSALLDVPMQRDVYPAITSAPSLEGTQRPICIGNCVGVPLTLVDGANLDYDVHDSPPYAIDQVTDQGVILTENFGSPTFGQWERSVDTSVDGITRLTNPAGKQVATVRGAYVGGDVVEQLRDVIEYCLDRSAGRVLSTDIEHYSIDALEAATEYALCRWSRDASTISLALTEFLDSFCGWWYFDRLGYLRVGRLADPSGEAVVSLTELNIVGDITVSLDEAKALSDSIGCVRNWSPHGDGEIAGSVLADEPERAAEIIAPQKVRKGFATLHPSYAHAIGAEPNPTLLSVDTDGQTEADRRTALYQDERYFYTLNAALDGSLSYALEPGDVVELESDRFGLSTSRKLLVVSARTRFSSCVVQLTLWGAGPG